MVFVTNNSHGVGLPIWLLILVTLVELMLITYLVIHFSHLYSFDFSYLFRLLFQFCILVTNLLVLITYIGLILAIYLVTHFWSLI